MGVATVTFRKCIQDSQEFGSDDEHMVSRIFFDLDLNDQVYRDLYVDAKQTVGGNFEDTPLEISAPRGYTGPFNHQAFRDAVETYYRSLVGSGGRGIHFGGDASNIRMQNNTFIRESQVQFDVSASDADGW